MAKPKQPSSRTRTTRTRVGAQSSSSGSLAGDTGDRPFMEFSEATTYRASASDEPKATIVYPPKERMKIRLAILDDVENLSRMQGDVNTWYTIVGISGGGAVGIVVTWVTNITGAGAWAITPAAVVALIAFLVLSAAFGYFAWMHGNRATQLREKLQNQASSNEIDSDFE